MGLFKNYLRLRLLPVGFATIHRKDDSDAQLKKPHPNTHVGFATIHKPLKEDISDQEWKTLRANTDLNARHLVHVHGGEHHAAYLHKVAVYDAEKDAAKARYYGPPAAHDPNAIHPPIESKVMTPGAHMEKWLIAQDEAAFPHHHEMNRVHQANHLNALATHTQNHQYTALRQYTHRSSRLNRWLIAKHKDPKVRAPRLSKEDKGGHVQHSVSGLHYHLARETNHKGNALHAPTIVHSGIGPEMATVLANTAIGHSVHFPAYTSTSTSHSMAHSFTSGAFNHLHGDLRSEHFIKHVVHFHLPKGYRKGRHVENITTNGAEHEMILHHGQTFKKVDQGEVHEHYYSPAGNRRVDTVIHHHFVPVS